jgi:hypothetical protein
MAYLSAGIDARVPHTLVFSAATRHWSPELAGGARELSARSRVAEPASSLRAPMPFPILLVCITNVSNQTVAFLRDYLTWHQLSMPLRLFLLSTCYRFKLSYLRLLHSPCLQCCTRKSALTRRVPCYTE